MSLTARGQGSGVVISDDHLHVLRIEDGSIREFWLHLDPDSARRDLGLTS